MDYKNYEEFGEIWISGFLIGPNLILRSMKKGVKTTIRPSKVKLDVNTSFYILKWSPRRDEEYSAIKMKIYEIWVKYIDFCLKSLK